MARPKKREPIEANLKGQRPPTTTQYTDGSLGIHLPNDIPIYLRAFRLVEQMKAEGRDLPNVTGFTVLLDAFTFGVKVYLRIGKDGTMRLIVDDADGRNVVAKWEK
jgi:hypothetical protein